MPRDGLKKQKKCDFSCNQRICHFYLLTLWHILCSCEKDTLRERREQHRIMAKKGNKNNIGTLIIKQPPQKKGRASMIIDKNSLSIPNNKRSQNFFKKRNSLNEMINKFESVDFLKHKTINCQADC